MSLGEALIGSAVAARSAVAVMPVVSGGGDASKDGSIRYAMAMKVKYRKHKKILHLALLGVHNESRAGVYPSPDRVVQLGIKILLEGCNPNEAHHAGVAVQDVPYEKRTRNPQFPDELFETMTTFNARHFRGSGELRECFREQDVQYGTLAHNHLLLRCGSQLCEHSHHPCAELHPEPHEEDDFATEVRYARTGLDRMFIGENFATDFKGSSAHSNDGSRTSATSRMAPR